MICTKNAGTNIFFWLCKSKDIGRAYLKSLMEEGKYETAARFVHF